MATATFSVRMDENLKKQFELLCQSFGMSMSTAFNIFAIKVVNEKRIPFEISAKEPDPKVLEEAKKVTELIRNEAIANGTCDLTEEEIEAEIALARKERSK